MTFAGFSDHWLQPNVRYRAAKQVVGDRHLRLETAHHRLDGVATVVVQGGRVPEFQVTPDPARLQAAGVTVQDILDSIRKTNLIDSPGLIENNHQLVLGLISGQVRSPEQIGQIVVKTTPAVYRCGWAISEPWQRRMRRSIPW